MPPNTVTMGFPSLSRTGSHRIELDHQRILIDQSRQRRGRIGSVVRHLQLGQPGRGKVRNHDWHNAPEAGHDCQRPHEGRRSKTPAAVERSRISDAAAVEPPALNMVGRDGSSVLISDERVFSVRLPSYLCFRRKRPDSGGRCAVRYRWSTGS